MGNDFFNTHWGDVPFAVAITLLSLLPIVGDICIAVVFLDTAIDVTHKLRLTLCGEKS